jgi:hypothetical protein
VCKKYAGGSYRVNELDEGSNEPLYPPKMRPCRKCKKPTSNYYRCWSCNNEIAWHKQNGTAQEYFANDLWGVTV